MSKCRERSANSNVLANKGESGRGINGKAACSDYSKPDHFKGTTKEMGNLIYEQNKFLVRGNAQKQVSSVS